ncbi:MAG: hypothetical protein ACYS21_02220 [Planctomycetota bacterium]|jgi:hypothetical protein
MRKRGQSNGTFLGRIVCILLVAGALHGPSERFGLAGSGINGSASRQIACEVAICFVAGGSCADDNAMGATEPVEYV